MADENPDSVIILRGGNDLPTSRNNPVPVAEIAQHIINTGIECRQYGAKHIGICSVLPRQASYMQVRRKDLNNLLRDMCIIINFNFIDNSDIILSKHILSDGVHLNVNGTALLADNLINYINGLEDSSSCDSLMRSNSLSSCRLEDCSARSTTSNRTGSTVGRY